MTRTAALVMLLSVLAWQAQAAGASLTRTIEVGGLSRTYVLHLPPSMPPAAAVPLVFVLHGGGGTGAALERMIGFSTLADREGFIAVYPDAVDRNWNDGRGDPHIPSQAKGIDDVGFISAVIARLSQEYRVDLHRIFATGISNGGFMSQLLAARLSDRIVAIAAVAAGMGPAVAASLRPSMPVSILVLNGTRDPLVPYGGGPVARNRGETIGTPEIIKAWTAANRCTGDPSVTQLPDTDPADGTRVTRTTYAACAQRSAVVLYTIEGGGHTWPGGRQYLPRGIVGRVTRDINGNEVIWSFFASHARP